MVQMIKDNTEKQLVEFQMKGYFPQSGSDYLSRKSFKRWSSGEPWYLRLQAPARSGKVRRHCGKPNAYVVIDTDDKSTDSTFRSRSR